MDRFFSKLDLRDIKIDPRGKRFPPDEAGYEAQPSDVLLSDDMETPGDLPRDPLIDRAPAPFDDDVDASSATAPLALDEDGWSASPAAEPAPAGHVHATDGPSPYTNGFHPLSDDDGDVLKVSARSRPSAVAGAIAGVVREAGRAEVQAIGAGATNQAVKAVAIARDYLRETGIEAVCLPAFIDITIDNEDRTAIRLVIEPR